MALDSVYLAQTFQSETYFQDNSDDPLEPSNPAQYTIYSFDNARILNGIGAQDTGNPYRWFADVTIPESAPYSRTRKYRIVWTIRTNKGNFSTTEYFNVLPQQTFDYTEIDSVYMAGDTISDNLVIDYKDTATNITVSVLDSSGTEVLSQAIPNPNVQTVDEQKVYGIELDDSENLSSSIKPYIITWKYKINGKAKREFHFAYVIGPQALRYMEQLRNFIDKIRFSHPNPRLRFNDIDLLGYLVQGVQIINGTKPQPTAFTLETVPSMFEWYLINAAAYVGLSAQYLAEGEQAFDFSGQTVTLTVDRTQYLDSALGRIQDVITTQLPEAKTLYAKSNARGVLGLSPSPVLNTRYLGLYFYGGSSDIGYLLGNRSDNYQFLLGTLL